MAVIHISEAEAARDLPGLLAKVRQGEQVQIDTDSQSFSLVKVNGRRDETPRLVSEILADMERNPAAHTAMLPDGFAEDVMDGIRSHEHDYLMDAIDSWLLRR